MSETELYSFPEHQVIETNSFVKILWLKEKDHLLDRIIWSALLNEIEKVTHGKSLIILRHDKKSGVAIGKSVTIGRALDRNELPLVATNIVRSVTIPTISTLPDYNIKMYRLKLMRKYTKVVK